MARVSDDTLRNYGVKIEEEMRALGLIDDVTIVVVEIGSKTYGRAFRLYTKNVQGGGGLSDAPLHLGDGFLGQTSGEARQSLRMIYLSLQAARLAR